MTLVELLIVIVLMFIAGTAVVKVTFPKEEDFLRQQPKEALEAIIKTARKTSNRDAQEQRIQFIDQNTNIGIANPVDGDKGYYFDLAETDVARHNSVLNFLKKTTNAEPTAWPTINFQSVTTAPLFLLTDSSGKAIFDENNVCYAVIDNPGDGPLTINRKPFEPGYVDKKERTWKGKKGSSASYFTVYPSGLCNSVCFQAESCPAYNRPLAIDALSGVVTQL
jgi:type II secretory pathway pseudopilin PulG